MITAHISGDSISSNTREAFATYQKSLFGERDSDVIHYSTSEALFLVQHKKMIVMKKSNSLSFSALLSLLKRKDKKIETKYAAYRDLRKKGYILKTALKFGADFRVYDKGVKPGRDHALWLLHVVKQHESLDWNDFAAKNRIAHSTKKNLLIAIVDEEQSVSYYEISWLRL